MELVHEGFVVVGSGCLEGLGHVCGCPRDECVASAQRSPCELGSYLLGQPSLSFATVSDEQLDRELRKRLVGTGEAHARTAFLLPKVSLQPRCASRRAGPQTCCLGFEGVLETPKRCIRRVVLG